MTGILALERAAPTEPMQPEQVERVECEYIRHDTLSLIANLGFHHRLVEHPSVRELGAAGG
jgi:hypothetical protein